MNDNAKPIATIIMVILSRWGVSGSQTSCLPNQKSRYIDMKQGARAVATFNM